MTLKEALKEAKYLQVIQEEKGREKQIQQLGLEEEEITPFEIQNSTVQRGGPSETRQWNQGYQRQNQGFQPRENTGSYQRNQDFRNMYQPRRMGGSYGRDQGYRRYQYRDPRDVECWACHQRGHYARECSLC